MSGFFVYNGEIRFFKHDKESEDTLKNDIIKQLEQYKLSLNPYFARFSKYKGLNILFFSKNKLKKTIASTYSKSLIKMSDTQNKD